MSLIKPSNITGLTTSHSLYSAVEAFYEFGQLNKELVSDTALTTTATVVNDAELGDCLEFDNSSDIVTPDLSFDGGGKTVLIVHKMSATFGSGSADIGFLRMIASGHILNLDLYNGIRYRTTFRGDYGSEIGFNSSDFDNQADLDAPHCFAVTLDEAAGIKYAQDGSIDTESTSTTNAYSGVRSVDIMSFIGSAVTSVRVGAIVLFNRVLTDGELASITATPWTLIGQPIPKNILDIDTDNTVYAGQTGVVVNCDQLVPPVTAVRIGGANMTIESQNGGSPIITVPLHAPLKLGVAHSLEVDDTEETVAFSGTVTLNVNPAWEIVQYDGLVPQGEGLYPHTVSLGTTPESGDFWVVTSSPSVTFTSDGNFVVDPPQDGSFDFKMWDDSTGQYTALQTYNYTDGGYEVVPVLSDLANRAMVISLSLSL